MYMRVQAEIHIYKRPAGPRHTFATGLPASREPPFLAALVPKADTKIWYQILVPDVDNNLSRLTLLNLSLHKKFCFPEYGLNTYSLAELQAHHDSRVISQLLLIFPSKIFSSFRKPHRSFLSQYSFAFN